jgi:hypothetical protein
MIHFHVIEEREGWYPKSIGIFTKHKSAVSRLSRRLKFYIGHGFETDDSLEGLIFWVDTTPNDLRDSGITVKIVSCDQDCLEQKNGGL